MKNIKWITIAIAALLLLLVAQNNFALSQSTEEQPIPKIPKVNVNFPDPVPDVDTTGSTQEIMDIWRNASKALDNIAPSGEVLDSFITGSIDLCTNLINIIIGSGFNVATITGWLNSCAAGAAGLLGGLGGGLGALISVGVSLLNTVGSAFVLFLQGIGFTIEGILGLAAIGAILSLIVNIVNFAYTTVMGLVNLAYTSGVGGIAVASLLFALVNMALSAVLIVVDVILLIAVLILSLSSVFLWGILVLAAPIIFFITLVIFFFFGLVTLAFKLQAMLSNLAAFPTGIITSFISVLTGILNLGSLALVLFNSGGGLIFSILAAIVVIAIAFTFFVGGAIVGFIFLVFLLIVGVVLGLILGAVIGAVIGLILGVIVGAMIFGIIGLISICLIVLGILIAILGCVFFIISAAALILAFLLLVTIVGFLYFLIIAIFFGFLGLIAILIALLMIAIGIMGIIGGFLAGVISVIVVGILAAVVGAVVGAIILGFIGLLVGLLGGAIIFFASFFGPIFAILAWFVILPIVYIAIFTFNFILSVVNFGEIMLESIVGVVVMIINSIMLIFIKMFVDMLEITVISEIVSVIVMFLQRIQESAPLTRIVAYPLEMCIGIIMFLFAIVLAGCNLILYPVNFFWQFIGRGLSSCYRIVCGPFIRPLGYEVPYV